MDEQINSITIELNKHGYSYVTIDNDESITNICKLYTNNILFEPKYTIDYLYLGAYHQLVTKDYELMKKYYLIAVDNGNIYAMNNLALHYEDIEKDYELMKKYYLMTIDNGDTYFMHNLGYYYEHVEKNYDLMKKYYLMAIDDGNISSMNNLGYYYANNEKNYDLMKKYYLMAIDKGYGNSMNNLGYYYEHIEKNYDLMKNYYIMAINNNYDTAIHNLAHYYCYTEKDYDKMKEYCLIGIEKDKIECFTLLTTYYNTNNKYVKALKIHIKYSHMISRDEIIKLFNNIQNYNLTNEDKQKFLEVLTSFKFTKDDKLNVFLELLINSLKIKIDILDLHFTYSMEGRGYEDAKRDFLENCVNI